MSFQTSLLSLLLAIFTEEFAIRGTHRGFASGGFSGAIHLSYFLLTLARGLIVGQLSPPERKASER